MKKKRVFIQIMMSQNFSLNPISLVELYFNKNKSHKRAGIFRLNLHYQLRLQDMVVGVINTEYHGENQLNKQHFL